jgi:hypothetical protein
MPTTRTTRARAAASNQDTPDAAVKSTKIPQTTRKASADKIQEESRPPSRQVSEVEYGTSMRLMQSKGPDSDDEAYRISQHHEQDDPYSELDVSTSIRREEGDDAGA